MVKKKAEILENFKRDRRADNKGRPPRYDKAVHPKIAKALCRNGATIAELANACEVAISTIWLWKLTHPEFIESCRVGLEAATERLERSMFERAVGYTHEATKIFMPAGADKPVYAPYLEHVPPDTRAGEFWLTNRASDRWKNKHSADDHNKSADSPIRRLAEQISGNAIRPRLPAPRIIENEPDAIRPQQPKQVPPSVTTKVTTPEPAPPPPRGAVVILEDDDKPNATRFHTVSEAYYQNDEN